MTMKKTLQRQQMSTQQTVLMLHGRKEPVLYTQHSAMMLHNALKYEERTAESSTY